MAERESEMDSPGWALDAFEIVAEIAKSPVGLYLREKLNNR